ncbi:baseplate J/gp47 family protein [Laribacter hongkongensis]|uniref:Baseplate assembly protein n=1 Tax=Laribacter hongkongensis TaxID=168471 RepID=A0A248LHU3_9NEIS|nr:baseplate J/gp47 family protein [Laribacter hongkongensis]ASJ24317.1 baseplate assembly protein [Laribacter hongkongensis]MCG9041998.1 baseplate J/gp47 family protein [Laribacter hongkongensis]MCG9068998.1 baseplate J/gp47 family protein [Laribacter hongkongensis]MCG9087720.1 baseplate J/gp47 family protein [Laribacter hongkongensis]MCG9110835.1 baseplate J/gp47 family protein [Laribacter hongkongensis]
MPSVDLAQLPKPEVIEEIDFESLLATRKARLIAAMPAELQAQISAVLALESEPLTALLQESAYTEMILRQRINEAAAAVTLAFSRGRNLDVFAANLDTRRKVLVPADPQAFPPVEAVMEPDDEFRLRAQMAFEGLSVAGPALAYEVHASRADDRVADVRAISPQPCDVIVTVLSREGDGTASAALLNQVTMALSDEDTRPLGDRVTVQSVVNVDFRVEAVLHIPVGPEAVPILDAATASLQAYLAGRRKIGRSIYRSAIESALHVIGVEHVELIQPAADLTITTRQVGHCTGTTLRSERLHG